MGAERAGNRCRDCSSLAASLLPPPVCPLASLPCSLPPHSHTPSQSPPRLLQARGHGQGCVGRPHHPPIPGCRGQRGHRRPAHQVRRPLQHACCASPGWVLGWPAHPPTRRGFSSHPANASASPAAASPPCRQLAAGGATLGQLSAAAVDELCGGGSYERVGARLAGCLHATHGRSPPNQGPHRTTTTTLPRRARRSSG